MSSEMTTHCDVADFVVNFGNFIEGQQKSVERY